MEVSSESSRWYRSFHRPILLILTTVLLLGCSETIEPSKRLSVERRYDLRQPILLTTQQLSGLYTNAPRWPRVNLAWDESGSWNAIVYHVPGGFPAAILTCKDTLVWMSPVMIFDGQTVPTDTTSMFLGDWEDTTNVRLPQWGLFQADYVSSWVARDTVISLIEGFWIYSVGGACQARQPKPFWIQREEPGGDSLLAQRRIQNG